MICEFEWLSLTPVARQTHLEIPIGHFGKPFGFLTTHFELIERKLLSNVKF